MNIINLKERVNQGLPWRVLRFIMFENIYYVGCLPIGMLCRRSSTNSICQSSCQPICSVLTLFDPKSYHHDGKVWNHECNRRGKSRLALKGFAADNNVYDHHRKSKTKNGMKCIGFPSDEGGEQSPFSFSMFTHLSVRMCVNRTWKFLSHFCCW